MHASRAAPWCVVVPVKRLSQAKSRLARLAGEHRADLALAFARHNDWRAAAAAARRRLYGRRFRVAISLRDEGRWAVQAGDTANAIAAFRWYLKLRDNPEPALVPAIR